MSITSIIKLGNKYKQLLVGIQIRTYKTEMLRNIREELTREAGVKTQHVT